MFVLVIEGIASKGTLLIPPSFPPFAAPAVNERCGHFRLSVIREKAPRGIQLR